MIDFIKWWVLFFATGIISFPWMFRIFEKLQTKGYGLSKVFGLLVWGYVFWIGNSFGLLSNSHAGALLIFFVFLIFSIIGYLKQKEIINSWIKENISFLIFTECLFLFSLIIILFLRISSPEIIGTEKPMELAFLNGINQSLYFPPKDPWLSGYSISYYYFGYLIINLIVQTLFTPTGIAFNLALIFWFGLIASGASDLFINITSMSKNTINRATNQKKEFLLYLASMLAPFFILILSNSEGFLELIHSRGIFWGTIADGNVASRFWTWIDIKELINPPALPYDWDINRPSATWWWRASRVLQDYTLMGQPREIINEFPFFSFFLGDLHPHLLAIPFVILCVSTAFVILLRERNNYSYELRAAFRYYFQIDTWIITLIFGSLIFLNTWDFPIYFGLLALVIFLRKWQTTKRIDDALKSAIPLIFVLGTMAILLYLPFLVGFSSQAGGVLPSLIYQSRSIHQMVMFFPLFVPIIVDLIFRIIPSLSIKKILKTMVFSVSVFVTGILLSYIYTIVVVLLPSFGQMIGGMLGNPDPIESTLITQHGKSLLSMYQAENLGQLLSSSINLLLGDPWAKILFLSFISIAVTLILYEKQQLEEGKIGNSAANLFWGLLLIIASALVLFPEIFFLRDQFGWRMNTIFKFYFQAWILFSVCSAISFFNIFRRNRSWKKGVLITISIAGLLTGMVYPLFGFKERIAGLDLKSTQLDGTYYYQVANPDEMEAVSFISDNGCGVIAEAVGGSYSNYGRISKLTGCQTVLGWPGHELQWRGSSEPLGSREEDVQILYTTKDWLLAYEIIDKYNIDYIFIGDLERTTYPIEESKFIEHMAITFQNDAVVIYSKIKNE